MPTKKVTRRKKAAPQSVGLRPDETKVAAGPDVRRLGDAVESDGGAVIGSFAEPFGGKAVLLVALPIERVEPTPFQRDASEAHVKRLMGVIEKIGRFLDPIIAVPHDGGYWTPNGNHRLQALKKLGARTVTALLLPDPDVAFKILALNTEKAHNLREKSLEVIRMARALAADSSRGREPKENDFAFEFEEPAFLTLGLCYEKRPRLSGGAYQSVLRRVDDFIEKPISKALAEREGRAARVLEVDDRVSQLVKMLQDRGLKSPYLKAFVVARVNPIRFSKATSFDFDDVFDRMTAAAKRFDVETIKPADVARAGGPPSTEG